MGKDLLKLEGEVVEELRDAKFRVKIKYQYKEYILICYLSGKMRQNKIKVTIGDSVKLELPPSPHIENSLGRITYRN